MPMNKYIPLYTFIFLSIFIYSCSSEDEGSSVMVKNPKKINARVGQLLKAYITDDNLKDTLHLKQGDIVKEMLASNEFEPLWSSRHDLLPPARDMIGFINEAKNYGLFPFVYHDTAINTLWGNIQADTAFKGSRINAENWAQLETLLTDALVQSVIDLKFGRLLPDTTLKKKISHLGTGYFIAMANELKNGANLGNIISLAEPDKPEYHELKKNIPEFLKTASFKSLTYLPEEYNDTAYQNKLLLKRLKEEGIAGAEVKKADSLQLAIALKKYQLKKGLTADGKAGKSTIRSLNLNDNEKFLRIAVTLDRYKLLPDTMPQTYVWVNIPTYQLKMWHSGDTVLNSKIICGKSYTPTPEISSAINEIITYPRWTIPTSIIKKEILPGLKRNPGYLSRRGYSLINAKGKQVNPATVNWSKYSKGIPFSVVQPSGDRNALGVVKFNFPNDDAIYLHDTNQRYLFAAGNRAMSHGCIRVEKWKDLAGQILAIDSVKNQASRKYTSIDSLNKWLDVKKNKIIKINEPVPVYLKYFTVFGQKEGIKFYEDIYNNDGALRAKYFAKY